MKALPDYLAPGLKVVFVGFNPGETSAREGHYYAYPGNRFYWLLWQSGLTDRLYTPAEDAALLALGYGLTDLVGRSTKSSADLTGADIRRGREELLAKLRHYRPRVVCCNGKGVYAGLNAGLVQEGRKPGAAAPGFLHTCCSTLRTSLPASSRAAHRKKTTAQTRTKTAMPPSFITMPASC